MKELPYKYPTNATLVAVADICVADRAREDYGNLDDLSESILNNGLIHPPTIVPNPDGVPLYRLAAGGRRTRACCQLDNTHIPVNVRESMTQHELLDLELIENFDRKDMTWQERCKLISKTHKLKVKANALVCADWNQKHTGDLLGVSRAHVTHVLAVTKFLGIGDTEIEECSTMAEAYKTLLRRKEDEGQKLKAQRFTESLSKQKTTVGPSAQPALTSAVDTIFDDDYVDEEVLAPEDTGLVKTASAPSSTFQLDHLFRLGDSVNDLMPAMDAGSVDHVVTDIPYGIDMANLDGMSDLSSVEKTHEVEQNVAMMPKFLKEAYRVLRTNGYCVFWYDLNHHEKLQKWATEAGFKVQRWPLVWHKTHRCKNSAANFNYTKDFEVAMVCRKGNAVLNDAQGTSIISEDSSVERKLYSNPFSKPFKVWEFILSAIAYPGQTILDPFAGQMSCPRAVLNLGMKPIAMELEPIHFNAGLNAMKSLLEEITHGDAKFM